MSGQKTNDPRFVSPEDLGGEERRSVSPKQYERLQAERATSQAQEAAKRWMNE